jgi:hypothetical protein
VYSVGFVKFIIIWSNSDVLLVSIILISVTCGFRLLSPPFERAVVPKSAFDMIELIIKTVTDVLRAHCLLCRCCQFTGYMIYGCRIAYPGTSRIMNSPKTVPTSTSTRALTLRTTGRPPKSSACITSSKTSSSVILRGASLI